MRTMKLTVACAVMLLGVTQAQGGFVTVAVFDDPAFVDTSGGPFAESDNVQASLTALGHTVNPFTGTSAGAFSAGIAGANVLLIPELENGDLGAVISAAAIAVIQNFVSSGGGLVQHGGSNFINGSDVSFLNAVFGFSLTGTPTQVSTLSTSTLNAGNAAGTAFAGGPASIPNASGTHPLTGGFPGGSLSIYDDTSGGGGSTVTLMPFGSGRIAFLGFDWFDAAPVGSVDGGWLSVLDSAVMEVGQQQAIPEPSSMVLFTLGAVGLGIGAVRRRRKKQPA